MNIGCHYVWKFDLIVCFHLTGFKALLDNYESATGTSEVVTPQEVAENKRFLNEIMKTKVSLSNL